MAATSTMAWLAAALAISIAGCASPAGGGADDGAPQVQGVDEAAIWALEREYWESNRSADVERIATAWHEAFLGWPQGEPRPVGKAEARDFARRTYSGPDAFTFELVPAGLRILGDVAVAHYRVLVTSKEADGRETRKTVRITHALVRDGGAGKGWKILGGMSSREEAP